MVQKADKASIHLMRYLIHKILVLSPDYWTVKNVGLRQQKQQKKCNRKGKRGNQLCLLFYSFYLLESLLSRRKWKIRITESSADVEEIRPIGVQTD